MRIVRWAAIGALAFLVVLTLIAAIGSRTETLRRLVVETLATRLNSDVELQAFSVDIFPRVDVRGEGLVIRLKGSGDLPPLISVRSFALQGGVFGLAWRPRTFRAVNVDGLEINIPPGGARFERDKEAADSDEQSTSPIHIDVLRSTDAVLRLIPGVAGKQPKVFEIHNLVMRGVGAQERMPFEAELTNPVPRGQIRTDGSFGPWSAVEPGKTPLDGKYVFDNADLSTIEGIGGILSSTGTFRGELGRIVVEGETKTPDFHLTHAKKPVPLTTRFEAIVDGTNGDTHLNKVDATLRESKIAASGAVESMPGQKGRRVRLDVSVDDGGRIEDFLDLAVGSEQPALKGRLALRTDFLLPPGKGDVIDRLQLKGKFALSDTQFTDAGVQDKLAGMSARARGKDPDRARGSVSTELDGLFAMSNGTIKLSNLEFAIPGATVRLAGTYGLRSEALNFDGTVRMQATISEAAGGGVKGFFLKAVDPLFRRKGAGAVIPIRIRGTRSDPKIGLDVAKAITRK